MATKTNSKTATRKPAAKSFAAGRKTTAVQKPAVVAPKDKPQKKGLETEGAPETTASEKQRTGRSEKLDVSKKAHPESVSLIDRKKSGKKAQDVDVKTKRTVLPPISRIRASLESSAVSAKPAPPPPVQASPPEAPPAERAEPPPVEPASVPGEVEAGPQQKVLLIKPPIVVKHFSTELGLKPHHQIAELIS
jgi:hypothetical protein